MNKILVVVDMQNDFLTGSLANESAVKVIPNIKREIESGKYTHIIFTRDTHDQNYLETQEGKRLPFVHCVKLQYILVIFNYYFGKIHLVLINH